MLPVSFCHVLSPHAHACGMCIVEDGTRGTRRDTLEIYVLESGANEHVVHAHSRQRDYYVRTSCIVVVAAHA